MTDYWNDFYNFEQGGGGVICKVLIQTGYKTYAEGFTGNRQEETFFPSKAKESNEQQAAKEKALAQCKAHPSSVTKKPAGMSFGVMIRQYLEAAVRANGQLVNWDCDQFNFTANFHDSTKEIVMPSLKEHGITGPVLADNRWEGWVRLAWQDDPYKVKVGKSRDDGRYDQVVYITEVFADEDTARAAIAVPEAEEGVSVAGQATLSAKAQKEGWDMAGWKDHWETTAKSVYDEAIASGTPMPLAKKQVAEANLVDVSDVDTMLAQHIEF